MGRDATKPVCGVSDKARLKLVSSATEASLESEISLVESIGMILSNNLIIKALMRMRRLVCACVVCEPPKTSFVELWPICNTSDSKYKMHVPCVQIVVFSNLFLTDIERVGA